VRDTRPPMITRMGGMPVGAQSIVAANGFANVANFELPVASDEVGLAIPMACTPVPGDPVASVELLVSCVAVDTSGNEASVEFSVFVRQPDANNDRVSDLVANGAGAFSDAALGGTTAGTFVNPGNETFAIGDAWQSTQGVRFAVRPRALRSSSRGPAPTRSRSMVSRGSTTSTARRSRTRSRSPAPPAASPSTSTSAPAAWASPSPAVRHPRCWRRPTTSRSPARSSAPPPRTGRRSC